MKITDIRMKAYKMGLDPDAATALTDAVGIEKALAVLEKTARFLKYEASLPAHPKKKSPDWVFNDESRKCRRLCLEAKCMELQRQEQLKTVVASKKALEKEYQPNTELRDQLREQWECDEITYKQYQQGIAFVDYMYGKEKTDANQQNTLAV